MRDWYNALDTALVSSLVFPFVYPSTDNTL